MKLGVSTERQHSRAGMLNIVVILLLTNVLLLLALLTTDIRLSQQLWWPNRITTIPTPTPISSPARAPVDTANPDSGSLSPDLERHVYGVMLNTSTLDTSRGEVRTFQPHGVASHLIIEFGAYRTGPSTFSVVALVSKRLHDLHEPPYKCEWRSGARTVNAHTTWPIKPDWDLGTMYGTMVVVCMFPEDVGIEGEGGSVVLSVGYADEYRPPEVFTVLTEIPGEYNASRWNPPFPYEYTFCVSRLYGNVSAQRIREWMAYHALLLGNSTHFLFHDAGGMSRDVHHVLKPWIELGRVSVQNLQLLEVYQGRSHHQFTMLNDCLFRAQTLSNWTLFFDVDEYMYIPPTTSLENILAESERNNFTQIRIKTIKVADKLCTKDPSVDDATRDAENAKKWAFEKLVYADCDYGWEPSYTGKYMLKPRSAWATGVHYCEHLKEGEMMDADEATMRLYHYHGAIQIKGELCRDFTNGTNGEPNYSGIRNCTLDQTMTTLGTRVKQFELDTIGQLPPGLL